MAQKIGLESSLDSKGIQKGASEYIGAIGKMQSHTADVASNINSAFSKIGTAATGSIGGIGKLGSALGGMATVAGGIVAANIFGKIAEGVGLFVTTGLSAVDSAQRLEAGLGALLTMNNLYERTTETMTVAVKGFAEEQANAAKKSDDLAFKQKELTADIKRQSAAIQEQRQRIIQMADGLDKTEQVAKLEQMEVALEGMNREMADAATEQGKLNNLTQEYTTVTKTSFQQVMNFSDAQKLAADQSKDLLAYVEKLAIVSPFEQDQVATVAKLATAAGLGVEQTKSFTAGFLDLASAVGIGSESLDFAADQLLQVAKVGKITTVDLRQLRRLGIDLEKIIGVQMGMSIEEFNDKAAKSPDIFNDLFDSVTEFSKNTFAGTAEKMASSLSGLKSTFMDIFKVSAKNLMRPLIDAVGPAASGFLGKLSDIVTGPELAKIGESIPKVLFGAFKSLQGGGEGDLFSGLKGLGLDSSMAKSITDITQNIGQLFAVFQANGVMGLAGALGVPPEILAGIQTAVDEVKRLMSVFGEGMDTGGMAGGFTAIFDDLKAQFSEALPGLASQILTQIPVVLTQITTGIGDFFRNNVPEFQAILAEWGPKFWSWVNTVIEGAGTALAGILLAISAWTASPEASTSLNSTGNAIGQALVTGVGLLFENSNEITNVMAKLAAGLTVGAAAIAVNLIFIGGQLVAGIISGILESLGVDLQPATLAELTVILTNIGKDAQTIAGVLGERLMQAIRDGAVRMASVIGDLKDTIGEKLELIWEVAQDILNPEKWEEIGINIIEGIVAGIEGAKDKVLEVLKSMASEALSGVMDTLGIQSPSTEFQYIGQMMAAGVTKGWKDGEGEIFSAVSNLGDIGHFRSRGMSQTKAENLKGAWEGAVTALWDDIVSGKAGAQQLEDLTRRGAGAWAKFVDDADIKFQEAVDIIREGGAEIAAQVQKQMMDRLVTMAQGFATFGDALTNMLQQQKQPTLDVIADNEKLTKSIAEQQAKVAELKAELKQAIIDHGAESEQVRKKREQIAKLTGEIKKNQQAMGKNQAELKKLAKTDVGANIELLKQFLAGGEMSFKYTLKKDLVGVNHVMLDRVAAQEKLNQLLEEERKQQEAIAKLEKAKADLAFLQQQLSIVQLIKDNGLNPADIFGGIQLGLNASINDLLAVTSNLVAAMVKQIDDDLQIASPSKLMQEKGLFTGMGLAKGLKKSWGVISKVMDHTPILGGGDSSGRGNYSTVNNTKNAPMNVVINAAGNRRVVSDIMMLRGRMSRV